MLCKSTFSLKHGVYLSFRSKFENEVKGVIIFVVVVELDNVFVVQLVHNFDLKFDLFHEIVLYNLGFVYDFDSINVLGLLVAYFVNLTKSTNSDIRIGK